MHKVLWRFRGNTYYPVPKSVGGPTNQCFVFNNVPARGCNPGEASILNDVLLFLIVAMLFSGVLLAAASVLAH
jgi:hypothetical protein